MNVQELEVARLTVEARQRAFDERAARAWQIAQVSGVLDKPKGIFWKKCPNCGKRLKREIFRFLPGHIRDYYFCDCGYEYATVELRGTPCP